MTATRFDLHHITVTAIKRAVACNLIDAVGAWELGVEFGGDEAAILDALCGYAYARRHSADGRDIHGEFCGYNDAYHAEKAAR